MAEGAILNFGAQRNEDYSRSWEMTDSETGDLLDITGWSFKFRIKSQAGLANPALLEVTDVATINGSLLAPSDGQVGILLRMADIAALPGRAIDVVPFAYNFIAIDSAGIRRADVRGEFIVEPGV